jgi:predicted metal-dependent HD superfamily phosphohydrolase
VGDLRDRWLRLLAGLGVPVAGVVKAFDQLIVCYDAAGRYYHTLDHVRCVLDNLEQLGAQPAAEPALFLAAWYHDAVYDTHAADNEEQSAPLAATALGALGLPQSVFAEMARLILLTKTHQAAAADEAGRQLLDADLGVLGEPPETYDAYALGIGQEYSWVPEADYQVGRAAVLARFLGRQRIYQTAAFFAAREAAARDNLRRELASLRG